MTGHHRLFILHLNLPASLSRARAAALLLLVFLHYMYAACCSALASICVAFLPSAVALLVVSTYMQL